MALRATYPRLTRTVQRPVGTLSQIGDQTLFFGKAIGGTPHAAVHFRKEIIRLIAGLVACYRGLSITGGGAKAVGNAVNETVVFAFMALFVINVVVTAIGIQLTAK